MQWMIDIIVGVVLSHFTGIIVAWSGTIATIPAGWALCDGTNGTPNLAGKFIRGTHTPGAEHNTGGASTHTHDFTADHHTHELGGPLVLGAGSFIGKLISGKTVTGTTDSTNHLPPWYKLAYIMKL